MRTAACSDGQGMDPVDLQTGGGSMAAMCAVSTSAAAQLGPTTKYTTFKATAAKPWRSPTMRQPVRTARPPPDPAIHVVESPKSGTLTGACRRARLQRFRLPPIKMPAQVLSYEAQRRC